MIETATAVRAPPALAPRTQDEDYGSVPRADRAAAMPAQQAAAGSMTNLPWSKDSTTGGPAGAGTAQHGLDRGGQFRPQRPVRPAHRVTGCALFAVTGPVAVHY